MSYPGGMRPALLLLLVAAPVLGGETLFVAPDVYNGVEIAERDSERAAALFEEGRGAAASAALRLASEALGADPGHAGARRVLGYELVDGVWMTPYQADRAKRGIVWDTRFGWVKPDDVKKLESGQRPSGRRWVSKEVDERQHSDIDGGWQVRTDHFVVTTNHSPEAGVALAAELENLFQVWRQLFAGYYLSDREIAARYAGERRARKTRRPFRVVYHRDKAGYVEHLRRRQPRVGETLGIYFDTLREAHFYHSDEPSEAARLRPTLYHEAVHQLFQESAPKAKSPGANANYWVIEGAACWFETLRPVGSGRYEIGEGGRLGSAAKQATPLPLAELTAFGQLDLQRRDDLAAIYAQSTGVVAMLMADREDREALVRYLGAVYGGRPDGEELARAVGRAYAELDAEYARFRENLSP